jgi:hypothetical protein
MKQFYWIAGTTQKSCRCGDCFIFGDGHMLWRENFFSEGAEIGERTPYKIGRIGDENCSDWEFHVDEDAPKAHSDVFSAN